MTTTTTIEDQLSRHIYDLCALLLTILRTPVPPAALTPTAPPSPPRQRRRAAQQATPAGFASLLLGASLALMLCGSVIFVIGFILMPWVIGFVMLFSFASLLAGLGRAFLFPDAAAPPRPTLLQSSRYTDKKWQLN